MKDKNNIASKVIFSRKSSNYKKYYQGLNISVIFDFTKMADLILEFPDLT